jgi:phospholipase D1/2
VAIGRRFDESAREPWCLGAGESRAIAGKRDRARAVLRPRRNCWRIEQATRAAILTNGCYFKALAASMMQAQRLIVILGWDLDDRLVLDPQDPGPAHLPFHVFLDELLQSRRDLIVRCLIWNRTIFYGGNRTMRHLRTGLRRHGDRFVFRLATAPLGSSHHQKLVAIDDRIAFIGGIDLAGNRWDRSDHPPSHPERITPDGERYGPVHDIQMALEGPVAGGLGALARYHWERVSGERLGAVGRARNAVWPPAIVPDFVDIPAGIARGDPTHPQGPVREGEALVRDAFLSARKSIYVETQYLAAASVSDALAESLRRADGPEIVIIVTRTSHGYLEHLTMGMNRDRLVRRLRRADRSNRLRVLYPTVSASTGEVEIKVHSKLIIVDDRLLRIGSSNLNNRSMGADTECDVALEAGDDESRTRIVAIRNRLLAELLQRSPRDIDAAIERNGSVLAAIDELNGASRLRPVPGQCESGPTEPIPGTALLDPTQPITPRYLFQALLGRARAAFS